MMFKRDAGVEKRLRRIVKGEEANIKLLEKQEQELLKAVEDNGELLETRLNKPSCQEVKLDREISRLREKTDKLQSDLEQLRIDRERSAEPFRLMDDDLRERLKIVRLQLETVRGLKDRSFSSSNMSMTNRGGLQINLSQIGIDEVKTCSTPTTPSSVYSQLNNSLSVPGTPELPEQLHPPSYRDSVNRVETSQNPFEN